MSVQPGGSRGARTCFLLGSVAHGMQTEGGASGFRDMGAALSSAGGRGVRPGDQAGSLRVSAAAGQL